MVRLVNNNACLPGDVVCIADDLRRILGVKESASHFRISNPAIEFNLFANEGKEREERLGRLRDAGFRILVVKNLDDAPAQFAKEDALREAVCMFNEERFWESHEILEQVWKEERGQERDAIQSLILTCAAFVHYQKAEDEICLSVLRRARGKMIPGLRVEALDLERLELNVDAILGSGQIRLFKLRENVSYPFLKSTTSAATNIVKAKPPASKTPGTG